MKFIKLHKDCFFRKFDDIGYLFQQKYRKDLVLDINGATFFEQIKRIPLFIDGICKNLVKIYNNVEFCDIKKDFLEFMLQMEQCSFVVMGESLEEINSKEKDLTYKVLEENEGSKIYQKKSIDSTDISTNLFLEKYFEKHPKLMSLQIEITPNCNLKCVHCYLSCGTPQQETNIQLPTDILINVLDQLKEIGTLEVTFTGGEAMLNSDFIKLLEHAYKNDLSISVLTNAILLNDKILETLKKVNVSVVQVSLYSMDANIHDSITQVKGSFYKTKESIEKLIENDIPVQIGCPILKENLETFSNVINWGYEKHLEVKVNSQITAKADFSKENLSHRLSLKETEYAINKIIEHSTKYQQLLKDNINKKDINPNSKVCGIGNYMMCLEGSGNFYPCPGFKLVLGNVYKDKVFDIWNKSKEVLKLRNLKLSDYDKCMKCPSFDYCNICPGKFYNESGGNMFEISDYFCQVAHLNKKLAENFKKIYK